MQVELTLYNGPQCLVNNVTGSDGVSETVTSVLGYTNLNHDGESIDSATISQTDEE